MTAEAINETVEADLWRSFATDPGGPARLRLFEAYLPFSRRIAAQVRRDRPGADLDIEDLRQTAAEALLQVLDRFDPSRGAAFEAFAARRIAGAVIDGIAQTTELRRQISTRNRIRAERARSLAPAHPERLSAGDALQALSDLAVDLALGFMLEDAALSGGPEQESRAPNAYESLAWTDTVKRVTQALERLPEQERTVIRLHYLQGLEFSRVADTLGLSRGRISQIHAAALQRLRTRLPRHDQLHFPTVTS